MFLGRFPFTGICVSFGIGILLAEMLGSNDFFLCFWLVSGMLLLAWLFFMLRWNQMTTWAILLATVGLGCTFSLLEKGEQKQYVSKKGVYHFVGRVVKPVQKKNAHYTLELNLKAREGASIKGRVKVSYKGKLEGIVEGTYIRGKIEFIGRDRVTNPQFQAYLKKGNYLGWGWIDSVEIVRDGWYGWVNAVYQTLYHYILSHYSGFSQHLALALVLGNKFHFTSDEKSWFHQAGLSHLLAVSGMHVGILFGFFMLLVQFLTFGSTRNLFTLLLLVPILLFYAFLSGESVSAFRSVLMTTMFLIQGFLPRPLNRFQILAISAFIQLLWAPSLLFDLSFQFSYGAMVGIFLLSPVIQSLAMGIRNRFRWVVDGLSVSLAAQWGVFPLLLFYFKTFPIYFLLTNLIIVPFVLVYCYLLFFQAVLVLVNGGEGLVLTLLDKAIGGVAGFVEWFLTLFHQLPGSILVFSEPKMVWIGGILWLLFFLAVWFIGKQWREKTDLKTLLNPEAPIFYRFAL
jgi:ComEC/Rec2-related protein